MRASTLRFYEGAGLLPAARRVSGRRAYNEDVLRRVALIRLAQHAGFTLNEIRDLFGAFDQVASEHWQAIALAKLPQVRQLELGAAQVRRWLEDGVASGRLRLEDCVLRDEPRTMAPASPAAAVARETSARRDGPRPQPRRSRLR